jgi:hypothetical protein
MPRSAERRSIFIPADQHFRVQSHSHLNRIANENDEARFWLILKYVLNRVGRGQIENSGFAHGGVRVDGIPE